MQGVIFEEWTCYKLYLQGIYAKIHEVVNILMQENIKKGSRQKDNNSVKDQRDF